MPVKPFVLHVEDDNDDVELLQTAFNDNGIACLIEVIRHGDRVFPWLEQTDTLPDVIVMDLNLPKMQGKEILVRLKSIEKYKSIPIVILTTSTSKSERDYCLQHGADEFITKPNSMEGFSKAVELIITTAYEAE